MGDAADHPAQNAAILFQTNLRRALGGKLGHPRHRPKTERIHHGNRPGSHGKDVPQDSTDACGRALEGLDETGMIVRLDLKNTDPAIANLHHPGVLTRTLQNARPLGRQSFQVRTGTLVAAMLAPHHAEDSKFGQGGLPAQDLQNPLILFLCQVMLFNELGGDFRQGMFSEALTLLRCRHCRTGGDLSCSRPAAEGMDQGFKNEPSVG